MAEFRVGTSGWVYRHWRGDFYPGGLRIKDELGYYASRFDTAEINASFYRLPTESAVRGWRDRTPEDFLFSWKGSRFITHLKRLLEPEESIELVFGRMQGLEDRMGPAFFQLPPSMKADRERLAHFLSALPREHRCAMEFRHPSWYAAEIFTLLTEHDAALVISDHHDAPSPWEAPASWVYVRGHGPGGAYRGAYDSRTLSAWAGRLRDWGKDAYVYFDNDIGGHAPRDADRLKVMLA
ncbi:MAG: DUF72 domain-containing protein [Proteobacteria bacterium]|nr:DUF72 domain-containing protein [Pseudomonadota bacterium]